MVDFAHLVDAVRSEEIGDSMMFILAPLSLLFLAELWYFYIWALCLHILLCK